MMKQWLLLTSILSMLVQASCTTSPGACPTPTTDMKLLMNAEDGYCLLYPAAYSTNPSPFIVINPAGPGRGDVLGDAWVSIDLEGADRRTAAQVADAQITPFDGYDVKIERTEVKVDGEQAIIVDGLPGPDPWRKVFIVHGDRLYTLTFLPWLPNAGQRTPLESLYETIMQTLHFLPPTKALPTPTQPWGPNNLPPTLSFEFPLDGQSLDYEGDYFFKVTDIQGAEGYLWSFSQNGAVVWENLRDEMGLTSGGTYAILKGSAAHSRFVPGPVEVSVRAQKGEFLADPVVITIILQSQ